MIELTQEERALLRQIYAPKPIPKCIICDEQLTLQDSRNHIYGCQGFMSDPDNEGHLLYKSGREFLDEHYKASRISFFGEGSQLVIKCLDLLEALENELQN